MFVEEIDAKEWEITPDDPLYCCWGPLPDSCPLPAPGQHGTQEQK
jgi:hypothetical protein